MTCAVAMNESMMCEMYERQSINLKVIDKNKGNHYNRIQILAQFLHINWLNSQFSELLFFSVIINDQPSNN